MNVWLYFVWFFVVVFIWLRLQNHYNAIRFTEPNPKDWNPFYIGFWIGIALSIPFLQLVIDLKYIPLLIVAMIPTSLYINKEVGCFYDTKNRYHYQDLLALSVPVGVGSLVLCYMLATLVETFL